LIRTELFALGLNRFLQRAAKLDLQGLYVTAYPSVCP